MGNSNTKESRQGDNADDPRRNDAGRSRNRMSRGDLGGFLNLQPPRDRGRDRQDAPFEHRETRQEREARRLEKERVARAKERERSVREEHVDGGYLVTMGTYTGTEDFSKPVVRQLQIERKLAPFWRGLNDWSNNWAEHQLMAAARGLPIPAADAPPDPDLMPSPLPRTEISSNHSLQNLMVPMGPRTLSAASDRSGSGPGSGISSPLSAVAPKSLSIKPRAKALAAALSVGSRNNSSTDLTPKEASLPLDPFVNGQPMEVYLYKDASECPICFLSYPPYLNRTRCCDQSICSECFVQIKRADPHLPEHHPNGEARDPNEGLNPDDPPEMLISEPSACPYCQQPEFGVTYDPPPFRRGLAYSMYASNPASSTAMSSQSSLNSTLSPPLPPQAGRRRTHSLSATAPNVITTDRVRPDWATKLAAARAHQARRSAAATALHTAAFLVGAQENRSILRSGRFVRRSTGTSTPGNDQSGNITGELDGDPNDGEDGNRTADGARRTRMEELEDMMFMEAVRLSLATEEDRKRKEEKVLRKEAKKRQQAEKKAQKKASKDPYGGNLSSASGSSLSLGLGRRRGNSGASGLRVEATVQGASQATRADDSPVTELDNKDDATGKGKAVDRGLYDFSATGSSTTGALPIPTGGSASRGNSHLRQMSNASSLGSSLADTPSGSYAGPGFTGPDGTRSRSDAERDTGSEPMFNFRSLAELVGVNLDDGCAHQGEGSEVDVTSSSAKDTTSRPLSQVKEEEKEGAEAEHVETTGAKETIQERKPPAVLTDESTLINNENGNGLSPKVTLTPGTPMPDDDIATAEAKQLGYSGTMEQLSRVTH
ncbi:SNF1-interacting protein [Conoideocrella luteorostrata]|uniref:SNF1-interacting protein n=1 Tax=Conoideocrella luteorostrata TaxID=1105319 RepID=A0AAJ0CJT6_9HYPO|nr:SNF1-interacting protein [Conoideocrella luteorostrata]